MEKKYKKLKTRLDYIPRLWMAVQPQAGIVTLQGNSKPAK